METNIDEKRRSGKCRPEQKSRRTTSQLEPNEIIRAMASPKFLEHSGSFPAGKLFLAEEKNPQFRKRTESDISSIAQEGKNYKTCSAR